MSNHHTINGKENLGEVSTMLSTQNKEEAIEGIRRMFVDVVQRNHIVDEKQTPAKRAAFIKQHGSAYGTFQVDEQLASQYQVGIFQPGASYEAWVRYSSDVPDEKPDKNTTVGLGIKLFGVPGEKMLEEDVHSSTLDFILQNTEVFFAADAEEMYAFKSAALAGELPAFLETHPETAAILKAMEERTVESVLTEPLWSCVPYQFGEGNYCKFKVDSASVADPMNPVDQDAANYLGRDLKERLSQGEVRLNFYVQLRNNPETQSIESARSLWKEDEAVPVKVATLILPQQTVEARGQGAYGETLSYNIWRTLPEMIPLGSIAEARKVVYRSSAQTRRDTNGQSTGEPVRPRPAKAPEPPYQPTFERPWSPDKDHFIEDFARFPETTIRPGEVYDTSRLKISNTMYSSLTYRIGKSTSITRGNAFQLKNEYEQVVGCEFIFNQPLKQLALNISAKLQGEKPITLSVHDQSSTMTSAPFQYVSNESKELVFVPDKGQAIRSLKFFGSGVSLLEIDDFTMEEQ
ncbi:hypothetical protein CIG19_17065 [Enterobacterales bacterium CwR94]|nr:hypothetical protein CIG19_17065 [Enterobacterales bacterium CwR94]